MDTRTDELVRLGKLYDDTKDEELLRALCRVAVKTCAAQLRAHTRALVGGVSELDTHENTVKNGLDAPVPRDDRSVDPIVEGDDPAVRGHCA